MPQHAADGEKRAKDDDSIGRLSRQRCGVQGLGGAGKALGGHVLAPGLRLPQSLQLGGRQGAGRGQIGEIPVVDDRVNARKDARQVFVAHGAEHGAGGGIKAHRVQIGRQRGHGVGVVRHIQHQGGLARHDLKAPWQRDVRHAAPHGLRRHGQAAAQGLQRGQRASGVHQLVGPAQGRVGQAAVAPPAPGPGPLLLVAADVEVAP